MGNEEEPPHFDPNSIIFDVSRIVSETDEKREERKNQVLSGLANAFSAAYEIPLEESAALLEDGWKYTGLTPIAAQPQHGHESPFSLVYSSEARELIRKHTAVGDMKAFEMVTRTLYPFREVLGFPVERR